MVGDILIIDCVATNRIVLKVKLLAAQYRVRPCATLHEAQSIIVASYRHSGAVAAQCAPRSGHGA
ncbi:hypothetical protein N8388_08195 [Octadecabacter sp.]|nr:hypothetical protein [Octadecabacter sp.]MDC1396926.1 hypothetical protein [Octadecabacter sp.]MDC1501183.1 hypothetical protein [Octadecabacter sp.]